MKKLAALWICCYLVSNAQGQIAISAADWQADLRFLQQTVHQDYPFLFKKITAEQFDATVDELDQAIPDLQQHEIVCGLGRIIASFGYGHTELDIRGSRFVFHRLPINLYHFSDGIYVEGAHEDYQSALGAKVLEIEGVPVQEALAAIRPVVPAENDQYFKAHGLNFVLIPEILHAQGVIEEPKQEITLTLQRDGKSFDQAITAVTNRKFPQQYGFTKAEDDWLSVRQGDATPLYLKNLDRVYYFEHLPQQKTVYVRHSQILDDSQEDIPTFYRRLFDFVENHDVDRLVLDLRLNGGGNNYKNKPIVTGIIRTAKINQTGKLFVIIGRRTFSACQNLVNELDNYTNAIFVGEPTSENINFYGDNRRVELPHSKIPVHLSFAWWQDKPQWENEPWLAPQVAVEMTLDDYRANRDPVLEAALSFSDEDFIRDPKAWLTSLFEAGKLEQLEAEAARLVKDPRYRFFDFEGEANQVGYELLGQNQIKEALFVFELNTKLFPESANTWDSLAEAHWRDDQPKRAIELYHKAIELDSEGGVAENARRMLEQIEAGKSPATP